MVIVMLGALVSLKKSKNWLCEKEKKKKLKLKLLLYKI